MYWIYLQLIAIAPVLYLFCYELQERKGQFPVPYCISGAGLDGIQLPDETQLCPGNLWRREISAGRHLFLRFAAGMLAADLHIYFREKRTAGIASVGAGLLLAASMAFFCMTALHGTSPCSDGCCG